ncbi:KTSC domain-containing protein [Mesorhizobium sp.]|uniref:KTSC domain-containing protein n=1 Tax=Mesorhizobium sp. TaxID=1871066 RepID=UPI0025BE52AD|nr:KTSC domain-containing protein [Mesorhizobium sp.]
MVVLLKQGRMLSCGALLILLSLRPTYAETVEVKYRGPVDLAKFECTGELDSSVVKRVCYNAQHSYMLIRLKQTWYHYCEIDQGTVDALLAAESKGRFYNANIKDSGTGGKFGCRDKLVPDF